MRLRVALLSVLFLLFACAGHRQPSYNSQHYTVKSGDTLYLIAWKYKLDYRSLARWNNLPKPYVVRPGQKLLIYPTGYVPSKSTAKYTKKTDTSSSKSRRVPNTYTVKSGDTLYSIARRFGVSVSAIQRLNGLSSSSTIYQGQRLAIKPSAQKTRSNPRTTVVFNKKSPPPKRWMWPTQGKVISTFKGSKTTQQGIDIAGAFNQPIHAVSEGTVVYQGKGLLRYGKTVIIKHNDTFLSAYAYTNEVLVKEGQRVKMGQEIATMGRIGRGAPALHLEIRENGKAVNPLIYLPKKP